MAGALKKTIYSKSCVLGNDKTTQLSTMYIKTKSYCSMTIQHCTHMAQNVAKHEYTKPTPTKTMIAIKLEMKPIPNSAERAADEHIA